MKVMILGSNGMLGTEISKFLRVEYDIITVARSGSDYNIDLLNFNLLKNIVANTKPDIIINCVAIVSLQKCEEDYELAFKTHVELPKVLSELNVYNILISTDSVFSGIRGECSEECTCTPLNSYSKTKFLGEKEILAKGLVLRTNIYGFKAGHSGNSLYEWAYKSISAGLEIDGYTNVKFNPVSTSQFATIVSSILFQFGAGLTGIYNIGGKDIISKFEFITKLNHLLGSDSGKITPKVYMNDSKLLRPLDTSMSIKKIEACNIEMPNFLDGIESVFNKSCLEVI
jgi:dTDP-4-dehydrorhamnose reductase